MCAHTPALSCTISGTQALQFHSCAGSPFLSSDIAQLIPGTYRHHARISYQLKGSKALGVQDQPSSPHLSDPHTRNIHTCSSCTLSCQSNAYCKGIRPLNVTYKTNPSLSFSTAERTHGTDPLGKTKVRVGAQTQRGLLQYLFSCIQLNTHVSKK